MWRLLEALAEQLRERGADVRLDARVVAVLALRGAVGRGAARGRLRLDIERVTTGATRRRRPTRPPARWTVRLADGEELPADVVIVAVPASVALGLLGSAVGELAPLSELDWPEASSVELVTLVLTDDRLAAAPRGTGVLVADAEDARRDREGDDALHRQVGVARRERRRAGRHVVRLSYGRVGQALRDGRADRRRDASNWPSPTRALLGIFRSRHPQVAGFARTRWTNALSATQALGERGPHRPACATRGRGGRDGLEVTGSVADRHGLASVIPDARESSPIARQGSTLEGTDREPFDERGWQMRGKLLFVTGAAVGYVLGARAGRKRYEQIKSAATKVWESPGIQKQVNAVEDFVAAKVGDVSGALYEGAKKLVVQAADRQKTSRRRAATHGDRLAGSRADAAHRRSPPAHEAGRRRSRATAKPAAEGAAEGLRRHERLRRTDRGVR